MKTLTYSELVSLGHGNQANTVRKPSLHVALSGMGNLEILKNSLTTLLQMAGFDPTVEAGTYDSFPSDIRDANSFLANKNNGAVVLALDFRALPHIPPGAELDDVRKIVDGFTQELGEHLTRIQAASNSQVILTNLPMVGFDSPGPHRLRIPGSLSNLARLFNASLAHRLPPEIVLCDVEHLSAKFGSSRVTDEKYWLHAKLSFAPDFSALVAQEITSLIVGNRAANKKLIVVDLDNTLWGGAICDDGLAGIELGTTSARGEGYRKIQSFLLSLKEAGFLLAVCSRNHENVAKDPFLSHPEMILRMEDLVSFKANWLPKSQNIRAMAAELNLLPESFVFIDDNPIEINEVGSQIPGITTILASLEPDETLQTLQNHPDLFVKPATREDAQRTSLYLIEAERSKRAKAYGTHESFLQSIAMKAIVEPFSQANLPRIAQLINKSNQFNLTTRRRSEGELQALVRQPDTYGFSIRLSDSFGDHGLVAVVICQVRGDRQLYIDTWLMSCRVLNRKVEELTFNAILGLAERTGCQEIRAEFIATEKNDLCKNMYPRLGFVGAGQSGTSSFFTLEKRLWVKIPVPIATSGETNEQGRSPIKTAAGF